MAATRIIPQRITRDGILPTYEAANPDGHTFDPGDLTFIEIINGGVAPIVVFLGQRPDNWTRKASGEADTATFLTVPNGERRRIGPMLPARFRVLAGGVGTISWFSTPTSVTIGVFEL